MLAFSLADYTAVTAHVLPTRCQAVPINVRLGNSLSAVHKEIFTHAIKSSKESAH